MNPKPGLAFAALGAVGGLIMAAAFLASDGVAGAVMPALSQLTGISADALMANTAGIVAYSMGVMGSMGAIFGLNVPKIATNLTSVTGNMLSGKTFGREYGPQPAKLQDVAPETPVLNNQVTAQPKELAPQKSYDSYRELLVKQAAENAAELSRR